MMYPLTAESPPSGERFVFHTSYRGPEKMFRFTWTLAPGKQGPGEHSHPKESHFFEVVSGELTVWLDDVRHDFKAGDRVTIPPGVAHRFMNYGTVPAVIDAALDGPALEDFAVPIAVEGQRRGGKLSLGLMALIIVQADATDPSTPTPRSRIPVAILRVFARVFRWFGVRPLPPVIGWPERPADPAAG